MKAGKKLDEEAERQKFLYGNSEDIQDQRRPKVIICLPKKRHEEFEQYLLSIGVPEKTFCLIPPLSTVEPSDPIFQHVKICLLEPKCSLSATADPLQFLLMEGIEDTDARLSALAAGTPQAQDRD